MVTRQGTPAGALTGLLIALAATAGLGAAAFAPLAVFVLGSGVLTRLGRADKERLGAAENNRGQRGASNVIAKLSVPAVAGALAIVHTAPENALTLVYVAALAGAFADTAATELGPLAGGRVLAVRGSRLVTMPHGVPGGMSAVGILAAAGASALIALCALGVGLLGEHGAIWTAAASGLVASVLESLFAGTPAGGRVGHFGRNLFVSLASAGNALLARAAGWSGS